MKKIVAIGSHYDDIELGCGGTLLNHIIKKDSIRLYVTNCDEHLTGHPMMRYEEQDKSLFYFK